MVLYQLNLGFNNVNLLYYTILKTKPLQCGHSLFPDGSGIIYLQKFELGR